MKQGAETTMLGDLKKEVDFENFEQESEEDDDMAEKPNDSVLIKTNHIGGTSLKDKNSLDSSSMVSSIRYQKLTPV